jgi:negative regulator of flagellin synthesis FlgM
MKISDIFPQIKAEKIQVKKNQEASAAKVDSASSTTGSDRVDLSTASADVQRMQSILQETPEIRMEKVEALKRQIERGEYQIDPYRVADKMLMGLLSDNNITNE